MTGQRIPSFGADVGRGPGGRFVKLDLPKPARRPTLQQRFDKAKARQPIDEPPVQRYRTTFTEMWRKVFG
jgi:hypothetical protein